MTIPEAAVQWAVNIANDQSHGYSQASRWGNPDYDISHDDDQHLSRLTEQSCPHLSRVPDIVNGRLNPAGHNVGGHQDKRQKQNPVTMSKLNILSDVFQS